MTHLYDGKAKGGILGADQANAIAASMRRSYQTHVGPGISQTNLAEGSHVSLTPQALNPDRVQDWFLGVIVDEGPPKLDVDPDAPAFEMPGAHYWVKEVVNDTTPGDDRMVLVKLSWPPPPDDLEEADIWEAQRGTEKWVLAANLSEMNLEDPEDASNAVSIGAVVKVFAASGNQPGVVEQYYFTHAVALGVTRFGLVVSTDGGSNARWVRMRFVVAEVDNELPYNYKFESLVTHKIAVWPGTKNQDYMPFLWKGENYSHDATVLPVIKGVDNIWYVQLLPKFDVRKLDGLAPQRTTDCAPAFEEVGG
jgi:hypothetical protein